MHDPNCEHADLPDRAFRSDLQPRRERRHRGRAANEHHNLSRNAQLSKERLDRITKRLAQCMVCGRPTRTEDGKRDPLVQLRTVGCWRIYACERHAVIEYAATLRGFPRFFERPPESAP